MASDKGSTIKSMTGAGLNTAGDLKHPFAQLNNIRKAQAAALQLASFLVQDPIYRKNLIVRARAGTLAAPIEIMLWHYILGKPIEQINITTDAPPRDMSEMTPAELKMEISNLQSRAESLMEKRAVLDG